MAPQNSTLIHENIESSSSIDAISRYSPILAVAECHDEGKSISSQDTEQDEHEGGRENDEVEIPIWICGEPRYVAGVTNITTCNDIVHALIDDEIRNGNYNKDVAVSRDSNDYVIIERWREVEQVLAGDTRILSIWNAWGNVKNEVQFRLKINKTHTKNANVNHHKENKSKNKEKIGLINRMMRKVLKQGEAIQNHLSMISQKSTEKRNQEKFRKYVKQHCGKNMIMESFLNDASTMYSFNKENQESCKCCQKPKRSTFPSKLFSAKKYKEPKVLKNKFYESSDHLESLKNDDELLLVIDHTSDNDSGIFTRNPSYKSKLERNSSLPKRLNFGSMIEIDKFSKEFSEKTPKRKFRSKRQYETLRNHNFNKRLNNEEFSTDFDDFDNPEFRKKTFQRSSFRFDLIRQEISMKMVEMQELLDQEEDLLRKLRMKSAKFQAENQLYRSNFALDFHVDKLQESIDNCAQEIIQIEQELIQTKVEIEEKSPLIENLRMLLKSKEDKSHYHHFREDSSDIELTELKQSKRKGLEFVDNIYEFCDNNQSFVV